MILTDVDISVEKIIIRLLKMRLKKPFETSFGKTIEREIILVTLKSDEILGWGECTADTGPWYSYETTQTALHIMKDFIIPILRKNRIISNPKKFCDILSIIRGNNMAKAAFEIAFWDLYAKMLGKPLYLVIGGNKEKIVSGVSIGIQQSEKALLERISYFLDTGYRRIKIKIRPGWDVRIVKTVRENFPDISLQVDANAAYNLSDKDIFIQLDNYNLLMIEQPLHYDDLVDHAILQRSIKSPICLDESIKNIHYAKAATILRSCKIINIKPGRVGGLLETVRIHNLSMENNIPVWIGGMLETGIGRAALIAAATLPNVKYPNDISASDRYWFEDIIDPPFTLNKDGTIDVPTGHGLGIQVNIDLLEKFTLKKIVFDISF